MATTPAPYDYKDYYTPIRGSRLEDTSSAVDKLRALFGALGIDQTPVDPQAMGLGAKVRGGLGLAPMAQPAAAQADVRKSDIAIAAANPNVPNFGAVPPPMVPTAVPAVQADVRRLDNVIAAPAMPVIDGAWAAPHGASPGVGAQLEPGAATPSVSVSRDANGNLVLTNAPPGGAATAPRAGPGAVVGVRRGVSDDWQNRAAPGSLASFFGASMNEKRLATTEAQNLAAAEAEASRMAELQKIGMQTASAQRIASQKVAVNPKDVAEATILEARLAAARGAATPAERNALLVGSVQPQDNVIYPAELQPVAGMPGYGAAAVGASRSGRVFQIPIQTAPKVMTMAEAMADAKKYGKNPTPTQIRLDAAQRGITIKD